ICDWSFGIAPLKTSLSVAEKLPDYDSLSRRSGLSVKSAPAAASRIRKSSRSNSTLGARIRRVRQAMGLSLAAVAGNDFSRAFLNQVELGRSRPSTRTL